MLELVVAGNASQMVVRVIGGIGPDAMGELTEAIRMSLERSGVVMVDLTAASSLDCDCADDLIALRRTTALEGARLGITNAPAALLAGLGTKRGEALVAGE